MGIIYDTSSKKFEGNFNPYRYEGAIQYGKHFSNLLYLDFISSNPRATFQEKRQAEAEMEIARKKMRYWQKIAISQGDKDRLQSIIEKAKKEWTR